MPSANSKVNFSAGLKINYDALTKDANTIYFCTDTKQIFVGDAEYTKSASFLDKTPDGMTAGDAGKLYAYNGNLYLCSGHDGNKYRWQRVANVNDMAGSVVSVGAGEGLTIADSDNPITVSGTIDHAIPTGAAATTDGHTDVDARFGQAFDIQFTSTDKFGHVIGLNDVKVTMPKETTYKFASGNTDGTVLVTPSAGSAYEVTVKGWEGVAKKSELASVFKFKGVVATVSALPTTGKVGDVYHVTEKSAEYVCIEDSTESKDAVWEELGGVIDLSEYAKSADVIQRVTGAEGEVSKFNADGTLSSTGFTLGCSVPADAVFTDTTYDVATQSQDGLMSAEDKAKLDSIETGGEVNVLEGIQVDGVDIAIDANKKSNITLEDFGVTVSASDLNSVTGKLDVAGGTITGNLTVNGQLHATADMATADADGNNIVNTYATKTELENAIVWTTF